MISYFIDLTDQVTKMTFYLIRLTSLVFEMTFFLIRLTERVSKMTFYLIDLTDRVTKMILLFIRGRDAALGASEGLAGSTFRLAGNVGLSKGSLMLYWRRCDRPTSVPGATCG
jgi:hypothetical protein